MIVDIIVGVVLVLSALIALIRGFIREVLTIVGVIAGIAAAYFGGPVFAPIVYGWFGIENVEEPEKLFDIIPMTMVGDAVAYGLIFVAVVVILSLVSHVLAESAKTLGLGIVDRALGTLFGVARGVLLVALLYVPFYLVIDTETKEKWFDGSVSFPYLEKSAEVLVAYIPEDTIEKLEKNTDRVTDAMKKKDTMDSVLERATTDKAGGARAPEQARDQDSYSEEFRKKMDDMFKQQVEQNETAVSGQAPAPAASETAPAQTPAVEQAPATETESAQ